MTDYTPLWVPGELSQRFGGTGVVLVTVGAMLLLVGTSEDLR